MLTEDFEVHNTLNPKLWDTQTNLLLPEVREKILEIAMNFESYISTPIQILDVQLVGSNASYNYTSSSDLDVHIIANFDAIDDNSELVQAVYDSKKAAFNKNIDINIHGVDIEVYVQDVNSTVASNGIYSVCDNGWVKEPKPIKSITKHNTEKELKAWGDKIKEVIASGNYNDINDTINKLYLVRTNSIATDGEYGKGNQLFKDIRNNGWLEELKKASDKALSKQLSLESYRGKFISEYYD